MGLQPKQQRPFGRKVRQQMFPPRRNAVGTQKPCSRACCSYVPTFLLNMYIYIKGVEGGGQEKKEKCSGRWLQMGTWEHPSLITNTRKLPLIRSHRR